MSQRVHTTFVVSKELYEKSLSYAQSLGLSFTEYIRYLLAKEVDRRERFEVMDTVTEERILIALEELKVNRYNQDK